MLPAVNRIGNLIQPHILGDQGEAAVIAYDSRIRVLQDFTHDADQITAAVKKIQPGSTYQHRAMPSRKPLACCARALRSAAGVNSVDRRKARLGQ